MVFVVLTPAELLNAAKLAGEPTLAAAEHAVAVAGAGVSVREIDGELVTPADLMIRPLEDRIGTRALQGVANAWATVHLATSEEIAAARDSIREAADGVHVVLAEREVVLADLKMAEILATERAADAHKTPVARIYAVAMEGARRAARGVELTAKETWILASVWGHLYGAGDEVGELKAVAGIGSPTPPATATSR